MANQLQVQRSDVYYQCDSPMSNTKRISAKSIERRKTIESCLRMLFTLYFFLRRIFMINQCTPCQFEIVAFVAFLLHILQLSECKGIRWVWSRTSRRRLTWIKCGSSRHVAERNLAVSVMPVTASQSAKRWIFLSTRRARREPLFGESVTSRVTPHRRSHSLPLSCNIKGA